MDLPRVCTERELEAVCDDLGLSERQRDLVRGVLDHKTDAEIADRLGLKTNTIRTYQRRLRRKLAVGDRQAMLIVVFSRLQQVRERTPST